MQIFMFRHAERENTGTSDPPLSRRGQLQSEKLAAMVKESILPTPNKCFSSPLVRAKQTFSKLDIEAVVTNELIERQNFESADQFRKRIQKFLHSIESHLGVVFFVTHLDWIEEALTVMATDLTVDHWPPGQMAEFDVQDGYWHFQRLRGCEP
jgi:phosphohistidine phosphatase SixA